MTTMVEASPETGPRDKWLAARRGFRMRCPACGDGRVFGKFLKVNDSCERCGEVLHHHRADDAPPYFTILIVGHIIGALILIVEERNDALPLWIHAIIWPTMVIALSLILLPRIKGALIAWQWALGMHGFGAFGRHPEPIAFEAMPQTQLPASSPGQEHSRGPARL